MNTTIQVGFIESEKTIFVGFDHEEIENLQKVGQFIKIPKDIIETIHKRSKILDHDWDFIALGKAEDVEKLKEACDKIDKEHDKLSEVLNDLKDALLELPKDETIPQLVEIKEHVRKYCNDNNIDPKKISDQTKKEVMFRVLKERSLI